MKRFTAVLLCCVACFAFAGCAEEPVSPPPPPTGLPEPEEVDESPGTKTMDEKGADTEIPESERLPIPED